jgi:predicted ABC-type ATPase
MLKAKSQKAKSQKAKSQKASKNSDTKKKQFKCTYKESDFTNIKKLMVPEKIAIFMVGSPGSGKTTLKEYFVNSINKNMTDFINLDPDYIMTQLPKYQQLQSSNETKAQAAAQCYSSSYVINDVLYTMAQNQNYNIILDGTGKEFKWTSGQIENLHYLGYTIYICIVVVNNIDILISRAKQRGIQTGRTIYPETIIKINNQIKQNIPLYKKNKRAKNIIIYNNDTDKPIEIYNKLKLKNKK